MAGDLLLALDPAEFARACGMPDLDPWQRDALRTDSPRVLMNCSRQSGKSSIAALKALHTGLYFPGSLILALAPSLRQSQELFAKVAGFYGALGEHRAVPPEAERKLSLDLRNTSRVVCLPGSEKTVRGFSNAALLIVDEAARVEDDLVYSIRPMLAVSGGALWMMSTPWGKRGVFFDEWRSGTGWLRFEVPAKEVPRISPEFLEEERLALGPWRYRQEYLCSFEDNETSLFAHEDFERAITPTVEPFIKGDY